MNRLIPLGNSNNTVFFCPYCKARTQSSVLRIGNRDIKDGPRVVKEPESNNASINFYMTRCVVCEKAAIYVEKVIKEPKIKGRVLGRTNKACLKVLSRKMIYPIVKIDPEIPSASSSMPKDIKNLYDEAASVFDLSPRSSGALIRLTLESLLKRYVFRKNGKRLDDMIGKLSSNYPKYIVELMDVIRTEGNTSVHNKIVMLKDSEDNNNIIGLFKFINLICDLLGIIKASDSAFNNLSMGQKRHIKNRNAKNQQRKLIK